MPQLSSFPVIYAPFSFMSAWTEGKKNISKLNLKYVVGVEGSKINTFEEI